MMHKKAFTLIELMLVVVIIGVIYGLVIGSMKKINKTEEHLDFSTLPAYLETLHQQNDVAFVCVDNCRKCSLYIDDEPVKKMTPFMKDLKGLRFWSYNANTGTRELRFTSIFDEDDREYDVCFRYEIFKDGSSTEMVVETRKDVYDYRGLSHKVDHYSSLQELEEQRQKELQEVLQ